MYKKHQKICLEQKPWVMKVPKGDFFAPKDFYQKLPFYYLGFADFECMSKVSSNKNFGEK